MDDIAKALGVSKGTVSKALSGAEDVSQAMRKLVVEKAVEMGYTRIMRSGTSRKICILVVHMKYENPGDFGYDIVTGFRKMAEPAGYIVDVVRLSEQMQQECSYDQFMLRENYQGAFILAMAYADPWAGSLSSCRTPAVLLDNHIAGNPAVTHVGVDNTEGMHMAVEYLYSLGHRRIGYLSSLMDSYVFQQRYQAFFDALRRCGLPDHLSLAANERDRADCIRVHLPRLVREEGCTAVLCCHDILARDVVESASSFGLRVPQDVSIIGFDDIPLCLETRPTLTTVRQDRTQLGKSAFYALQSQIGGTPISTLMLHASLAVRESTAPAAAKAD